MKVEYGKIFISIGSILCIVLCLWLVFSGTSKDNEKLVYTLDTSDQPTDSIPESMHDTISLDRASYYNAQAGQTDSSPFRTADGSTIDNSKVKDGSMRWVALSRELIDDSFRNRKYGNGVHWTGEFKFGDTIVVSSESFPNINGQWVVHDCMNSRYSKSIDFLAYPGVRLFGGKGVATDVKIVL